MVGKFLDNDILNVFEGIKIECAVRKGKENIKVIINIIDQTDPNSMSLPGH